MIKSTGSGLKRDLFCSFCGESSDEVRKLIAGPTVFICNECVDMCFDIGVVAPAFRQHVLLIRLQHWKLLDGSEIARKIADRRELGDTGCGGSHVPESQFQCWCRNCSTGAPSSRRLTVSEESHDQVDQQRAEA